MTFGYLIVVSTSDRYNYLEMAYALALSIKNTQKPGYDKVALVIDNPELLESIKSPWVFDHVIKWDQEEFWNGRSWMDQLTPFDYTVCLEADMLFLRDYSHWIEYFIENCELYIPNCAYSYREEKVISDFYRKVFTDNCLPNMYSFYTFFKKDSNLAQDFFKLGRYIIKNPIEFSNVFMSNNKPLIVGTDEAFSLSAKILGIDDQISYDLEFLKIVHFKPAIQGWPSMPSKCSDMVGFYLNKGGQLKIGNINQTGIVHYFEKNIMNSKLVRILEEIAWKI